MPICSVAYATCDRRTHLALLEVRLLGVPGAGVLVLRTISFFAGHLCGAFTLIINHDGL
jgi:hypothetical protein